MLPPITTLDLKVGDSETLRFEVTNDDDTKIDLTGCEAEFSVNRSRKGGLGNWTYLSTDSDPVVSVEIAGPSDPDYVEVRISPGMTREWTGGKAVLLQAEVTITDTLGGRRTISDLELDMRGEVRFEP